MARGYKVSNAYSYPLYDNNVRTTKAPYIGFEWEVAFKDEIYDDWGCDYDDLECFAYGEEGEDLPCPTGFHRHLECGCLEYASPVSNTISAARKVAKHLINQVEKSSDLVTSSDHRANEGGIHVSVADPHWRGYSEKVYRRLMNMLHRKSSAKFIWAFSGRKNGDYWGGQGISLCWDTTGTRKDLGYDVSEMTKQNCGRIEYRLWKNDADLLIPAIEFAHSTYKFCRQQKDIPYLKDYKKWLFKQKGYVTLKKQAPWELIHD